MTMRLAVTVLVRSPQGELVELGPDSVLPEWAPLVIDHPRAWEGGQRPAVPLPQDDPACPPQVPLRPAGNASTEEWHAYALTQGHTEAELEGLGRDGIRALFED